MWKMNGARSSIRWSSIHSKTTCSCHHQPQRWFPWRTRHPHNCSIAWQRRPMAYPARFSLAMSILFLVPTQVSWSQQYPDHPIPLARTHALGHAIMQWPPFSSFLPLTKCNFTWFSPSSWLPKVSDWVPWLGGNHYELNLNDPASFSHELCLPSREEVSQSINKGLQLHLSDFFLWSRVAQGTSLSIQHGRRSWTSISSLSEHYIEVMLLFFYVCSQPRCLPKKL